MCRSFRLITGFLALIALFLLSGCRTWVEKSTLPSKRYLEHPPQYIPPSPVPPLPSEAQTPVPTLPPALDPTLPSLPGPQSKPRSQVKDPYVAELLDLISQTKSVDAFLVSVSLLAEAKAEARLVIPAVIRNAERLGIYGRYAIEEKAKGAEIAKDLTELIGKMIKTKGDSNHKKNRSAGRKDSAAKDCNSADPNVRMEQLLKESEDLRQIQEEWQRFWLDGQPLRHGAAGPIATVSNTTPGPSRRTQIRFVKPAGMKVSWPDVGRDGKPKPEANILGVPGRYNFSQGAIYRLKLSNIKGRPGLELFPTLEVVPSNPKTEAFLAHNAVPIEFTQEDIKRVLGSDFLVKVIYLPDPKFQDSNGGIAEILSTRLEKGTDPIQEALRRGSILVVLRMGNVEPKMPNRFRPGR
jgi:hypothetical protein